MPEPFRLAEGDLPDRCFGYVPSDGTTSDRKLPICDDAGTLSPGRIGAAAAALGPGFRGRKVSLPSDAVAGAKRKVRAAWKSVHPDKDDDDMPAGIKAVEPAAGADDDQERPTRAYLSSLWAQLKELTGDLISRDDFDAMHRKARATAGGSGRAAKRRQDAAAAREHAELHPAPVVGCDSCGPHMEIAKLPKHDERVNFRHAEVSGVPEGAAGFVVGEHCGNCRFYGWGSCQLVEGTIEADDLCDLYLKPPQTYVQAPTIYQAAGDGGTWRLFTELPAGFFEAPEWVNVLPRPGAYAHPEYGAITITPERNQRFVANFDAKLYQQDLPITLDIAHDGKMSGAVGYIDVMRVNDDGSVDARVEWTDRGKAVLAEDKFRYFSPEWWDLWTDPATGDRYEDVLVGGAITVRPFFKEDALRSLVASEGWVYAPERASDAGGGPAVVVMRPLAAVVIRAKEPDMDPVQDPTTKTVTTRAEPGPVALTETEVAAFREWQTTRGAESTRLTEMDATIKQLTEDRDALKSANEAAETAALTRRFTDEVRGRSDANSNPWAAGPSGLEGHVGHLLKLAEAFGHYSDEVTHYVATNRAYAEQIKASRLFKPLGAADVGEGASATDRIMATARTYAEEHKVTLAAAVDAVVTGDRDLAADYQADYRSGRTR